MGKDNPQTIPSLVIHKLSQAQYDREREAGRLDPNAIYLTPEEDIVLETEISKNSTDQQIPSAKAVYDSETRSKEYAAQAISEATSNLDVKIVQTGAAANEKIAVVEQNLAAQSNEIETVKGDLTSHATSSNSQFGLVREELANANAETLKTAKEYSDANKNSAVSEANAYTNQEIEKLVTDTEFEGVLSTIQDIQNAMATDEELAQALETANGKKVDKGAKGSATQPIYFDENGAQPIAYTIEKSVPPDAKFTDTTYTLIKDSTNKKILLMNGDKKAGEIDDNNTTYEPATNESTGLMSKEDKAKLDGIAEGANKIIVDSGLSGESENPVQNKAVTTAINKKANTTDLTSHINNKNNPHGVTLSQLGVQATATEVNYLQGARGNLQTQIDNLDAGVSSIVIDDALSATSENPVQNKVVKTELDKKVDASVLAVVAKSGSYNDLSDKPTIPSISGLATTTYVDNKVGEIEIPTTLPANGGNADTVDGKHADYFEVAGAEIRAKTYADNKVSGVTASTLGVYTKTETDTKLNKKADLDSNGLVLSSQLPSYVDDVLEYTAKSSFPTTGTTGKIYVDTSTNLTYRWGGSSYVEISPSLALGETSSTAYRGDRGKIAYDHSQSAHAPSNAEKNQNAFSNVTVGSTTIAADNTTDTLTIVAGDNVTLTPDATNDKITIAAKDTTYGAATTSANGLMSSGDKTKLNGIASGAEVNQNAFSNITVGSTTIAADAKTDTLTIVAGSNITLTPDATNDKLTIAATNTDTKVTAVGNHYTPTADSAAELKIDASSTTSATWGSTDLVTGVNIQRDAKGHVTGVTVDSIQMPANPNVDTKVTNTLATTTKAYVTGTTSASTNTGTQVFDTGIYLDTTAGRLAATSFKIGEGCNLVYDTTNKCVSFQFI